MMNLIMKIGVFIASIPILFILVGLGPVAIMIELAKLGIEAREWFYPLLMFTIFFTLNSLTHGALTSAWRMGRND